MISTQVAAGAERVAERRVAVEDQHQVPRRRAARAQPRLRERGLARVGPLEALLRGGLRRSRRFRALAPMASTRRSGPRRRGETGRRVATSSRRTASNKSGATAAAARAAAAEDASGGNGGAGRGACPDTRPRAALSARRRRPGTASSPGGPAPRAPLKSSTAQPPASTTSCRAPATGPNTPGARPQATRQARGRRARASASSVRTPLPSE